MDGLFLYLYSMKIVVITAAYKREQLTELFYQSLNNQGLDIYCAVSNDVDEALAQKYCKGVVRCANNPVSDKFNKACDLLRGVNFDYAMVLGSDDFLSDNFIIEFIPQLEGDYIAFKDIYFYRTGDKKQSYLKYGGGTSIPIGAGRTFSKRLIERYNYKLWDSGLNRLLDTNSHKRIKVPIKVTSCKELGVEIVDVKHGYNITNHSIVDHGTPCKIKLVNLNKFNNLVELKTKTLKYKQMVNKKNLKKVTIIKDYLDLKEGSVYHLQPFVANRLVDKGVAKIEGDEKPKASKQKSDEDMTLKELRSKYPDITANSKKKFLEKLNESHDCEDCDEDAPCKGCEEAAQTTNIPNRD